MKDPITPEGAASAQNPLPPVPTTKILAISHFMKRIRNESVNPYSILLSLMAVQRESFVQSRDS